MRLTPYILGCETSQMEPLRACAPASATVPTSSCPRPIHYATQSLKNERASWKTSDRSDDGDQGRTTDGSSMNRDLKLTSLRDLDMLRRPATNRGAWEDLTHYIYGLYQ